MLKKIKESALSHSGEITELRRHFHGNPEIGWEEVETTDKIAEVLEGLGIEIVKRGFGGTESGLVADLKGGKPGGCVGLRADIDALPLQEENDVPYASRNPGVMHACGHDAHAAMLLGAAMVLSEIRDEILSGTGVGEGRVVVEQRVEPDVEDVAVVPGDRHAPAELAATERDVLKALPDEGKSLVAARLRRGEVGSDVRAVARHQTSLPARLHRKNRYAPWRTSSRRSSATVRTRRLASATSRSARP